ncbi:MAG: hypothetical protein QNI87_07395 [Erythrobacter sp.]|uniref:tetratricopeptide repeat protein n=1 Tax=Erythrobacter sp. TaxID=1042 RepID=UPI0026070B09|nr:hypothetical protein [Erythrobacter sp.]MDJ0978345.1 hypothetical protein [Erythrobacter sp.]
MSGLAILLPLMLLQVGLDPTRPAPLGAPDELVNRPPRPVDKSRPVTLSDPNARWLGQCLTQLESDASRAHSLAQIKLIDALGEERVIANHCLGLAATELGLWEDARAAFVAARDETPADQLRARARFGAMAGNAALGGGDAAGALTLLDIAQADATSAASASLQVIAALDTARALVALERPEEALAPLETATTLAPEDSEGWLLKATLLRRLDRLDEAQAAIEKAAALSPQESEVGLEAGVIAILAGRDDAARASWQSVIDVQPDSLAAQKARDYLAQIGPAPSAVQEGANP